MLKIYGAMFPSFLQRVLIVAGIAAGGWLMLRLSPWAQASDGTQGLTLLLAGSPWKAVVMMGLATLGAAALGAVVGMWGNPLAGVFTLAGALACAAVAGGEIEPWLRRADSSRIYLSWAVEAWFWGVLIATLGAGCLEVSRWAGARIQVPDSDPQPPSGSVAQPQQATQGQAFLRVLRNQPLPIQNLLAGLTTAAVGAICTRFLLPTPATWQVVWGLVIAFAAGALAAHQLVPRAHPIAIVLGPFLCAVGSYAWIGFTAGAGDSMLAALFQGRLWAGGLALPVHYASAGVGGAVLGMGWSQYLRASTIA